MKATIYKNVEFTNKNTILFKDENERRKYLDTKEKWTWNVNERIITESVKIPVGYPHVKEYTYLELNRNIDGREETAFYFIVDVEHTRDDLSTIYLELDVIQTHLFNFEIADSFIEREHQPRYNGNERVFNLEDEPIGVRDYEFITTDLVTTSGIHRNIYPIIITTNNKTGEGSTRYGSIPSKTSTYVTYFEYERWGLGSNPVYYTVAGTSEKYRLASLQDIIDISDSIDLADITILPFLPDTKIVNNTVEFLLENQGSIQIVQSIGNTPVNHNVLKMVSQDTDVINLTVNPNSEAHTILSDFLNNKVKEPKVFTSQFSEITVYDSPNNETKFYFEEIERDAKNLNFRYNIGNGVEKLQRLSLREYRVPNTYVETQSSNSLPIINDEYINYINTNKNSRNVAMMGGIVKGIAGIGVSAMSGGSLAPLALSSGIDGVMSFASEAAKRADLRSQPNKMANNPDNVDYNLKYGFINYKITIKVPTQKERERLEDYFYRFGYAAKYSGVPNLKTREVFNYIELREPVIVGSIPRVDKARLGELFTQGIRFWHKPDKFLDFTVENNEVKE